MYAHYYVHVCVCACMWCVRMFVCMYVCVYVCMCAFIHVCIYVRMIYKRGLIHAFNFVIVKRHNIIYQYAIRPNILVL